ncbi:MAG: alcohol dehydrogenase catalytic domain-containing protein [Deltaproteobacteria bacterium]|nr:alcohol dehydrogenase catalytic domain-containing protein [Deltaproteobacteria bacterium]
MRAVVFDGELRFLGDYPIPEVPPGWALIRVNRAGICRTDMEIIRGYSGFKGVLGHEFLGTVVGSGDPAWNHKRVAGEINVGCGACDWCKKGLERHCLNRKTLGIHHLDGCMADYCTLPATNLLEIPDAVPDERAILLEPLSAACEILEQVSFEGSERVIVLGDGKLGVLCAWVLTTVLADVTLVGHHEEKLETAGWSRLKTAPSPSEIEPGVDVVVEATGSEGGLGEAMALCRPRGMIVLKSTLASQGRLNLAPVVVNEITVIGSRCGRFTDGLRMLMRYPDMPLKRLVTARFPVQEAAAAFARAAEPDAFKVILEMS